MKQKTKRRLRSARVMAMRRAGGKDLAGGDRAGGGAGVEEDTYTATLGAVAQLRLLWASSGLPLLAHAPSTPSL